LNRGFLAIGGVLLLLGSLYIAFTIGFLFFGWGGQYRYELFYFPSPVAYTVDSLTSSGRMVSMALPIVAVLSLLLGVLAIRIPSPGLLSTKQGHSSASLPGTPRLTQFPTGILAVSTTRDFGSDAEALGLHPHFKRDFLSRLFPYEGDGVAPGRRQAGTGISIESEMRRTTGAFDPPPGY
jgi:hypothetical protein